MLGRPACRRVAVCRGRRADLDPGRRRRSPPPARYSRGDGQRSCRSRAATATTRPRRPARPPAAARHPSTATHETRIPSTFLAYAGRDSAPTSLPACVATRPRDLAVRRRIHSPTPVRPPTARLCARRLVVAPGAEPWRRRPPRQPRPVRPLDPTRTASGPASPPTIGLRPHSRPWRPRPAYTLRHQRQPLPPPPAEATCAWISCDDGRPLARRRRPGHGPRVYSATPFDPRPAGQRRHRRRRPRLLANAEQALPLSAGGEG